MAMKKMEVDAANLRTIMFSLTFVAGLYLIAGQLPLGLESIGDGISSLAGLTKTVPRLINAAMRSIALETGSSMAWSVGRDGWLKDLLRSLTHAVSGLIFCIMK
jgi:hypothetical protein